MNKHLLLTTDEESNIAVIRCKDEQGEFENEQVALALSEHFDEDVQVNSIENVRQHPLRFIVKYSADINGELGIAFLDETWVY